MANKVIYPYGVGGETPSGIEIVDYTTGGNDKAASAESVKELAQYVFMGSGSFADAYDKAKTTLTYFPWLLEDTDKDGNAIKKMIWHVGNKQFIDAIGAKVDGVKNGVTVTTEVPGYMRIWDSNFGRNATTGYNDYEIVVGENNFSFEDLKGSKTSGFDTHHFVEFVNADKTAFLNKSTDVFSVDFGGMIFTRGNYHDEPFSHGGISGYPVLFSRYKGIKSIKRLGLNISAGNPATVDLFHSCSNLEDVQIAGSLTTTSSSYYLNNWFQSCTSLVKCDISGLINSVPKVYGFFNACDRLEYLDMRGFDFSAMTNISNLIRGTALKTVILGNCDTSNVTSSSGFMSGVSGATLVLTETTPPAFNIDFINGHFTSIKVPATALTDYQEATGWSTYANIMTTYEEGEY